MNKKIQEDLITFRERHLHHQSSMRQSIHKVSFGQHPGATGTLPQYHDKQGRSNTRDTDK